MPSDLISDLSKVRLLDLVRPLVKLRKIAARISMGDLKTVINIKGSGEVALLARAYLRMQTSVRAAIEQLQKRRKAGAGIVREARQ
jgi:nitrate/nitrite-specific signal transduction histidine kinase